VAVDAIVAVVVGEPVIVAALGGARERGTTP